MLCLRNWFCRPSLAALILSFGVHTPAGAEPQAAQDGTNTQVSRQGNQFQIEGGTQAGANLFHSFEHFDLEVGQRVNFVGSPDLANILSRVTGGRASVIDGVLHVSNSAANLFLINPAGVIFGPTARLDVGGSFTATTATRLGFEHGFWHSFGPNNYATLTSSPRSFVFDAQTSLILNQGQLAVQPGQNLWLVGNSVLNLGTLEAPGGNITIAAVPGDRALRIDHERQVLSLVLEAAPVLNSPLSKFERFKITDLPAYLTGGARQHADTLTVADDGRVYLKTQGATGAAESLTAFDPGDVAIAGPTKADTIQLMAAGQVKPTDPNLIQAGPQGDRFPTVVRFPEQVEADLSYTFIDQRADQPQALLYGGAPGTIATIILEQDAGLETVTQALLDFAATGQTLAAINLVAEGNEGYFWLGNTLIDADTLASYSTLLKQWRSVLGPQADLLLYSCFTALGLDGEALINQLTELLNVDVAASTDVTGSTDYNGNWQLEYATGAIAATNPFTTTTLANWQGKLATQLVTNNNDAGADSLRAAFGVALAGDLITFANDFAGSARIVLTSGEILWDQPNLTVDAGPRNIVIDGGGTSRIFNVSGGAGGTITGVTLTNARSAGAGGSILNSGNLTIRDSVITDSRAANANGGAIANNGSLTITGSTIRNNGIAAGNYNGGGIANSGSLSIADSTIASNTATSMGGGIFNTGTATIRNSTISGNGAPTGGGIASNGQVSLRNTTIAADTASTGGGFAQGNVPTATLNLANSIIADSSGSQDVALAGGTVNFLGNNLIESGLTGPGVITADPNLTGLGNAGGPTQTHFLRPGSPALDAGTNAAVNGFTTDQRGGKRLVGTVDLGAVEFQGTDLIIETGSGQSTSVTQEFSEPLAIRAEETFFKNPLPGLQLQFSAPQAGASAQFNNAAVTTNADGRAFTQARANTTAGTFQARVTTVNTPPSGEAITPFNLANLAGPATRITFLNNSNQLELFTQVNDQTLVVQVTDAFGNPVEGARVRFLTLSGGGVSLGTKTTLTNADGRAQTTLSTFSLEANLQVIAELDSGAQAVFEFTGFSDLFFEGGCPPSCEITDSSNQRQNRTELAESDQTLLTLELTTDRTLTTALDSETFLETEQQQIDAFTSYLGVESVAPESLQSVQSTLAAKDAATGTKTAFMQLHFGDASSGNQATQATNLITTAAMFTNNRGGNNRNTSKSIASITSPAAQADLHQPQGTRDDPLQVSILTADGAPLVKTLPFTRGQLYDLRDRIYARLARPDQAYQQSMQAFYRATFAQLEAELQAVGIDNLLLSLDEGLRSFPWIALYDGEQFLIEKYSLGITPSISLTDTTTALSQNRDVLVMGADQFEQLSPLPAVPLEVAAIAQQFGQAQTYLNQDFTLENLIAAREVFAPSIIHLATHASFAAGNLDQSFIQFWGDERLSLNAMPQLEWYANPPVDLLVLSACQTVLGNREAELGFAGLAVNAGVRSAIASLWSVSDTSTLALMTEFYRQLRDPEVTTKAEALRRAQIELLRGNVRIEDDQLRGGGSRAPYSINLRNPALTIESDSFTHPYYWAG
ncbi:MAG: CHAT domain-containing protein, partial [Cyanobacteria bacterium P01_H01_bin.121]